MLRPVCLKVYRKTVISRYIPACVWFQKQELTQQTHNVVTTPLQHCDVVATLCICWKGPTSLGNRSTTEQFFVRIKNLCRHNVSWLRWRRSPDTRKPTTGHFFHARWNATWSCMRTSGRSQFWFFRSKRRPEGRQFMRLIFWTKNITWHFSSSFFSLCAFLP